MTTTSIPAPYRLTEFILRRKGIADDPTIDVLIAPERDFVALNPRPVMDYAHYTPRVQKIGLKAYKDTLSVIARRFAKISDLFPTTGVVLEVGAADGGFLRMLKQERPGVQLVAVEPDQNTLEARNAVGLAGNFPSVETAADAGVRATIVCLFHVFEHISEPAPFLQALKRVLAPNGRIVIEVPSLDDPLLSLYASSAYDAFYFQRQHPYVYSGRSLRRVLEANGLAIREIRPYQRYGLENHLAWLMRGEPGGDVRLAKMFSGIEEGYREALEHEGTTDTVFAVATAG